VGVLALELRPCVVDHRTAHEPAGEELLLAPDVRARELAHRAGLLQLLRGGLDLGRALADLQVRKARLGGAQSFLGFRRAAASFSFSSAKIGFAAST
jgi:hypothetical protein